MKAKARIDSEGRKSISEDREREGIQRSTERVSPIIALLRRSELQVGRRLDRDSTPSDELHHNFVRAYFESCGEKRRTCTVGTELGTVSSAGILRSPQLVEGIGSPHRTISATG